VERARVRDGVPERRRGRLATALARAAFVGHGTVRPARRANTSGRRRGDEADRKTGPRRSRPQRPSQLSDGPSPRHREPPRTDVTSAAGDDGRWRRGRPAAARRNTRCRSSHKGNRAQESSRSKRLRNREGRCPRRRCLTAGRMREVVSLIAAGQPPGAAGQAVKPRRREPGAGALWRVTMRRGDEGRPRRRRDATGRGTPRREVDAAGEERGETVGGRRRGRILGHQAGMENRRKWRRVSAPRVAPTMEASQSRSPTGSSPTKQTARRGVPRASMNGQKTVREGGFRRGSAPAPCGGGGAPAAATRRVPRPRPVERVRHASGASIPRGQNGGARLPSMISALHPATAADRPAREGGCSSSRPKTHARRRGARGIRVAREAWSYVGVRSPVRDQAGVEAPEVRIRAGVTGSRAR